LEPIAPFKRCPTAAVDHEEICTVEDALRHDGFPDEEEAVGMPNTTTELNTQEYEHESVGEKNLVVSEGSGSEILADVLETAEALVNEDEPTVCCTAENGREELRLEKQSRSEQEQDLLASLPDDVDEREHVGEHWVNQNENYTTADFYYRPPASCSGESANDEEECCDTRTFEEVLISSAEDNREDGNTAPPVSGDRLLNPGDALCDSNEEPLTFLQEQYGRSAVAMDISPLVELAKSCSINSNSFHLDQTDRNALSVRSSCRSRGRSSPLAVG
ncbi:unnamed protein product, partial [Amoebophrya sp. A120]